MALEGIVLYLLLVKIFRSKTRPARDRAVFMLCGWGKFSLNKLNLSLQVLRAVGLMHVVSQEDGCLEKAAAILKTE